MNLDINRKKIDTGPIKQLMIQGEIDADVITFKLPSEYDGMDITGLTYVLRAVSRKETMTEQALLKSVEGDFLYLTWTVTADFTAVSGEIQLELRGFDEEESIVIKFTGDPVFVAPEIGGGQVPEPSAINAAIDQLQILVSNFVNETLPVAEAAAEAATTAAVNPAYIGENGNWFTFDADLDEYVDSGVAAQGPEGPEGPAGGPPGPEGPPGADGVGVPPGGSAGQVLTKASGGDFDTEWSDVPDTVEIVNNLTETIPGKALDATQGKALGDLISSNLTKENILHNPDFKINRRTQTSYSANGYAVDRWVIIDHGNMTLNVNSSNVTYTGTGNSTDKLWQKLEFPDSFLGKTYTLSVLTGTGVETAEITLPSARPASNTNYGRTPCSFGFISLRVANTVGGYVTVQLEIINPCTLYRIKLELGSVSTLANDPPADYGEQLALCQRYAQPLPQYFVGWAGTSSTITCEIPLPTTIRTSPSLTNTDASAYRCRGNGENITPTAISVSIDASNNVRITFTGTFAAQEVYYCYAPTGVILSADL